MTKYLLVNDVHSSAGLSGDLDELYQETSAYLLFLLVCQSFIEILQYCMCYLHIIPVLVWIFAIVNMLG